MKKRNIFFAIVLALVSFVGLKSYRQIFATAEEVGIKTYSYIITQSDSGYTIVGNTTSGTYELVKDSTSLSEAIEKVSEDANNTTSTTTLTFKNTSLSEDLNISLIDAKICGTINLNSFQINFTAPQNSSKLTLSSLTINSSSSQNYINIGNKKTELTITNTSFKTTSQDKPNYAIHFEAASHSIKVSDNLYFNSTYFYNHEIGITSEFKSTTLTNNDEIQITVPYNEPGQNSILSSNTIPLSSFKFVPLSENYSCKASSMGNNIYINTSFNIIFNANGGKFDSDNTKTCTTNFNSTSTTYPIPIKEHSTFVGYIGKIEIGNNIYYFDSKKLNTYLNSNNLKDLSSSIFDTEKNNTFNSYTFNNNNLSAEFLAVNFMLANGKTPEFVAIWTDTIYKIEFVSNNSESINPITGTQGSSITNFPANPTKTGYSFEGWYTSSNFTDDTPKTSADFKAMPSENITLYAKWTKNSYNLVIFPNNGDLAITESVPFEKNLSEILSKYASTLKLTGHKFVKWCSDSSLETEFLTETMPATELSVYAKWDKDQFTITLISMFNGEKINLISPLTRTFEDSITDYKLAIEQKLQDEKFIGYTFQGWFNDELGESSSYTIPETMPAKNLTLYGLWRINYYNIEVYYFTTSETANETHTLYYNQTISLNDINISGYVFNGWYLDKNTSKPFNYTNMPNLNLKVYANLLPKGTISIETSKQSYTLENNNGYLIDTNLSDFKIEYFVNNSWTTSVPTQKGSYNVKITRNEDANYNSFSFIIEDGLTITPNELDLKIASIILYFVAGFEIIFSIIILFLRKQRQTYLNFAIVLPFGIVSKNQFITFAVALTLAVFGFVLAIIQLTKLKRVNAEIAKISTENEQQIPQDVSENESVSKNVEILLRERGFVSANYHEPEEEDEELAEAIKANEKILSTKPNKDTTENQTDEFDPLEDINFDDKD